MEEKKYGTVKWFNHSKGTGFVVDDAGIEYFFQHTAIVMDGFRTLVEGQRVSFLFVFAATGRVAYEVYPEKK